MLSPEENAALCTTPECGHKRTYHGELHHLGPCAADAVKGKFGKFCKCKKFHAVDGQIKQEEVMAKEKKARVKKAPKVKEGRKPKLAGMFTEATEIFATFKGKELSASVHADGVIVFKDKDYTSPSDAAKAATGGSVNGWRFWKFRRDGQDVWLDVLRGFEPKAKKARKVKAVAA